MARFPYPKLAKTIDYLVDAWGPLEGRTRLQKLVFLSDYAWFHKKGRPFTESNYYLWNHGPFAKEFLATLEWLDGIEIIEDVTPTWTGTVYTYRSGGRTRLEKVRLPKSFRKILDVVANEHAESPLTLLLEEVYALEEVERANFGQELLS